MNTITGKWIKTKQLELGYTPGKGHMDYYTPNTNLE